jgi:RNA polymerase sigma-70 factor (ECF subfamily)
MAIETVLAHPRPEAVTLPEPDLGRLFDRCHRRLLALARRMSHDAEESRDLVQETFLRAARRIARLPRTDGEAEAWLVRVLINLCKDRERQLVVRRRHARAAATTEPHDTPAENPAVARDAVHAALAELPPRRRACLVLHELEGLSVREVADVLGTHPVTVRWHLAAARKQLAAWRERHAVAPARRAGGEA